VSTIVSFITSWQAFVIGVCVSKESFSRQFIVFIFSFFVLVFYLGFDIEELISSIALVTFPTVALLRN